MNSDKLFDSNAAFSSGKVLCNLARYIFQTPQRFDFYYHMLIMHICSSLCSQFSQGFSSFTTAVFSPNRLFFCLEPLFSCLIYMLYSLWSPYIQANQNVHQAEHYFIHLHLDVSIQLIIYIMVLYRTRSHSFISSWAVELLSFFPIKVVARKCNPWLHFTPQ